MLLATALTVLALASTGAIKPTFLRCEYLENPEGVGEVVPRLSWKLEAANPKSFNLRQSAYQVIVASNENLLSAETGDMWDSGKVASKDTTAIEYAGKQLTSRKACYWKVRVWDQDDNASDWSKPAKWSMGLLSPRDWSAKWIGYDDPADKAVKPIAFKGARWIWYAQDKPGESPVGKRFFSKQFTIAGDITTATLIASCDDQLTASINGAEVAKSDGQTDAWRRPLRINVAKALKAGENTLTIEGENSEGGWGGLIFKIELRYRNGETQTIASDGSTKSAETRDGTYAASREVTEYGGDPWGMLKEFDMTLPPPRLLRKEFEVTKPIKRAVVYFSALGLIETRINGKAVCEDFFIPGWTDYTKRVCYRAVDVTRILRKGANAIGAILGDGWYSGYVGYGHQRDHYGKHTRAIAQLDIEYTDGTAQTIGSNESWRASTGAILESDFLMGEAYDARKESKWDEPGYKGNWYAVDVTDSIAPALEAFTGVPVRNVAEFKAKKITEPKQGVYILDLGQNIAGFASLKLKGKPGQRITLRFAERLADDGTMYTVNLRGARAIDTYVCKGEGIETWFPRFTFHGFQYIEVSGLTAKPAPDEVVGIAISSDTPPIGAIETSDAMINKLVSNAWWTQRMNFIDIPTDCPQRDERLGWTGDAQAYIRTACMNADAHTFFTKWLVTLDDSQREDGQFPTVAPVKVAGSDGGPAWADAGVICPWTVYELYGDKRLLARHYPAMKKFVEFCVKRSTPDLLPPAQFHCFGDWVSINAPTPNEVIYEAYFACSTRLLARAAGELGMSDDKVKYDKLYGDIKKAFQTAYVSPDGVVKGDSQCSYVLALAFDLVDGEVAKKCAAHLVADIERRGWHLSTGFVGTRDIMWVLSKVGRNDVAFRLLHNTTFPSWGFTIKNGATSIWERWDGWTPEKGFQDPGMNSFAHYAFGAVVGWVYDQIGGIREMSPGFETAQVSPEIDPKLDWAKTSYDSIRGKIVCEWRIENGKLKMKVAVPPNMEASIRVPTTGNQNEITSAQKLTNAAGVFKVGSGEYTFEAPFRR